LRAVVWVVLAVLVCGVTAYAVTPAPVAGARDLRAYGMPTNLLYWTPGQNAETAYQRVMRRRWAWSPTDTGSDRWGYREVGRVSGTVSTFSDATAVAGEVYTYVVQTRDPAISGQQQWGPSSNMSTAVLGLGYSLYTSPIWLWWHDQPRYFCDSHLGCHWTHQVRVAVSNINNPSDVGRQEVWVEPAEGAVAGTEPGPVCVFSQVPPFHRADYVMSVSADAVWLLVTIYTDSSTRPTVTVTSKVLGVGAESTGTLQ